MPIQNSTSHRPYHIKNLLNRPHVNKTQIFSHSHIHIQTYILESNKLKSKEQKLI